MARPKKVKEGKSAEVQVAELMANPEEVQAILLDESIENVIPVVAKGRAVPVSQASEKVQLKHRKTGKIIAMSVKKELAVVLAAQNPNIEII